jgi:endogenous inhibitor of DNA gyrase (YacG/DUF329 family)
MRDSKRKLEIPVLGKKCPNCRKSATLKFRPFCTKRCADMDLSRWLNEDYSIPGDEVFSHEEVVCDED